MDDAVDTELAAAEATEQGLEELAELFASKLLDQQQQPTTTASRLRKRSHRQLVSIDFGSQDPHAAGSSHQVTAYGPHASACCQGCSSRLNGLLVAAGWGRGGCRPGHSPMAAAQQQSSTQGQQHPCSSRPSCRAHAPCSRTPSRRSRNSSSKAEEQAGPANAPSTCSPSSCTRGACLCSG
jgi:hypothetical protein